MFQYAAGMSLAQRTRTPLLLDRSLLDRPSNDAWTTRSYELDVLRIHAEFATEEELRWFEGHRSGWRARLLGRGSALRTFRDPGKRYDPEFGSLEAPVMLEGYWQSERYFASIAASLRNEVFVPVAPLPARNAELLERIHASNSASVHVRRGDYVDRPETASYHGVPSSTYYTAAMAELVDRHAVETFFIFTDDPGWTRANLTGPRQVIFVDVNHGRESHWDMYLMKHCKHHIIANSSFSWWGAWLNASLSKTVIAPARWFAGSDAPHDILPPTWLAR